MSRKKWCEHIIKAEISGASYDKGDWIRLYCGSYERIGYGWKFCPICGKPRPETRRE